MIIDVRAVEAFNEGHIVGAVSMPEANIDSLVAQIPKDSLVVAYCQ
jgi:rhodanese-related sulfurtransferase